MTSNIKLNQLLAKFELAETLGTGAFSEVKVAIERATGNKFAIKIVDKSKCKGKESMIETEVSILMRVRHENIIQLYEMYEIDSKIYLVMELVTGGELFDDIVGKGKYTERDTAKVVYKILLAIDYLHSLGIAHRDLKPENLLLSDKSPQAKIMISDFGLSKIFSEDEIMRTACGTPGYVAPEVLKRQGYGKEIDLWSLGVITYILLCGYPPFYDQNNVELFKQIMAGRFEFDRPWWDNISEKAKDFIRKLLVLDPKARSTARVALSHPFIIEHCGHTDASQLSQPTSFQNALTTQPDRVLNSVAQPTRYRPQPNPTQPAASNSTRNSVVSSSIHASPDAVTPVMDPQHPVSSTSASTSNPSSARNSRATPYAAAQNPPNAPSASTSQKPHATHINHHPTSTTTSAQPQFVCPPSPKKKSTLPQGYSIPPPETYNFQHEDAHRFHQPQQLHQQHQQQQHQQQENYIHPHFHAQTLPTPVSASSNASYLAAQQRYQNGFAGYYHHQHPNMDAHGQRPFVPVGQGAQGRYIPEVSNAMQGQRKAAVQKSFSCKMNMKPTHQSGYHEPMQFQYQQQHYQQVPQYHNDPALNQAAQFAANHNMTMLFSAQDTDMGRPISQKNPELDDSGCVTSNDSLSAAAKRAKWGWKGVKWGW